jgi:uncharacterized protein YggT (Ycf19 family)
MKHVFGRFILLFITIYSIMLLIRILLSWIRIPQYRWVYWLCKFTDPVIDFFRKNFPIKIGLFDLSIATPILLLYIIGRLTNDFLIGDLPYSTLLNVWYILILLITITKFLFGFILFIFIIFTFILLITKLLSPNVRNPVIETFQTLLNPMLSFLDNILKLKSYKKEIIYLIILLIFFIVINGLGSYFLEYLKAVCILNLNASREALNL